MDFPADFGLMRRRLRAAAVLLPAGARPFSGDTRSHDGIPSGEGIPGSAVLDIVRCLRSAVPAQPGESMHTSCLG